MRKAGLRPMRPVRARPRTTVSDPRLPTFENVLERDFAADATELALEGASSVCLRYSLTILYLSGVSDVIFVVRNTG